MKISNWSWAISYGLLLTVSIASFSQNYPMREVVVPKSVEMRHRLKNIFANTKLVCFGRYALEIPIEAQLDWGSEASVEVFDGGMVEMRKMVNALITSTKKADDTAQITYNDIGPGEGTWQVRYYQGDISRDMGILRFKTFVVRGAHIFRIGDLTSEGENEPEVANRQASFVQRLRLRGDEEVPSEAGLCTPHGFISQSTYHNQEIVNAGIYIPSLPDVRFSISSNKDAYSDYDKQEFEDRWRLELSLLGRIAAAKKAQPLTYPHRDVFREGKRDLHHWHGEESLYKRKDGVHDFEWALVGMPGDVANPSEFNVKMYSRVAHNTVGGAAQTSLTDDEAVALFDRLLSGLKFRVKVPGAPEGSYYFPEQKTVAAQQK